MRKFKTSLTGKVILRCKGFEKREIVSLEDIKTIEEKEAHGSRYFALRTTKKDQYQFFPSSGKKFHLFQTKSLEEIGNFLITSSPERSVIYYKENRVGAVLFFEGFIIIDEAFEKLTKKEELKKFSEKYGLKIKTTKFLNYFGFELFEHYSFQHQGDYITENEMLMMVEEESEKLNSENYEKNKESAQNVFVKIVSSNAPADIFIVEFGDLKISVKPVKK